MLFKSLKPKNTINAIIISAVSDPIILNLKCRYLNVLLMKQELGHLKERCV